MVFASATGDSSEPAHDLETLTRLLDRLRQLSPANWERIRDAVRSEREPGIEARWRHARRRSLWMSPFTTRFRPLAQLAFMGGELIREFHPPANAVKEATQLRAAAERSANPLMAAIAELGHITASALPDDAVAREAVLIAATAVGTGPGYPIDRLIEAYQPLEAVVPLTSLRVPERP